MKLTLKLIIILQKIHINISMLLKIKVKILQQENYIKNLRAKIKYY